MQIGKNLHGKPTYLVFCHGSHDEFRLIDVNLQEYNPKTTDPSAPAVKKAFAEQMLQTKTKTTNKKMATDCCDSVSITA